MKHRWTRSKGPLGDMGYHFCDGCGIPCRLEDGDPAKEFRNMLELVPDCETAKVREVMTS